MTETKPLGEWTRKEFENLPRRQWNEDIGKFNSLIVLPTRRTHESGYRLLDFIAVNQDIPLCRLSGCSDVLNLDGVGGYGKSDSNSHFSELIESKAWSIDCLKKSGLIRIFSCGKLMAGPALSNFELYSLINELNKDER